MSSCSALDDCISDSFSGFSIDGVADFVQNDVVGNVSTMLGYVSDAMKVVDSAVSDAARLLQGDISVLLPPPSSGKNFVEQVQKMWRTGKRLYPICISFIHRFKVMIKAEHAGDTCSAFSDVVNFVVGRTQDFAGSAVVVDVPGVRKNDSEHFYTSVGRC